ncbi:four helix bundle protein [Larkinella arboricola]|uniref:Four helix bundle protein n=1 Tax=Larkinella arboricola TaxID=643671 RepID=A0A327WU12_LARAB|nr:four helix bundle protein [Larkinella arboricola]RAJ95900.1 four helix bundle protein [Larkinella arboricola]
MERKESIIQGKTFAFGVRTVNLYKWLVDNQVPYKIAEQLLRSGTSIGANVEEATGGYSRKDFSAKIGIAYKEARETRYWLRLLQATDYLNERMATSMLNDCEELIKILSSILLTTQENAGMVREENPDYSILNS